MATEQLVELFAVEPSKMHNSTKSISSSSSQKPSKKKNRRNAQSDMDQKFDLEELWDQSQVFVFISFFFMVYSYLCITRQLRSQFYSKR